MAIFNSKLLVYQRVILIDVWEILDPQGRSAMLSCLARTDSIFSISCESKVVTHGIFKHTM